MSNIIEPIRDRRTGEVKTNAQVVREAAAILDRMRSGVFGESTEAHHQRLSDYNRVTNNCDPQIIRWFEEAAKIKDDRRLKEFIDDTLLPIEGTHEQSGNQMSAAERKAARLGRKI